MSGLPGIDHIVLCSRDLAAARDRYRAMGFTMTPPAMHPFGTGNSLAQLGSSFIELLSVMDPGRIPPHGEGRFSFAAHNSSFLTRAEGMSMLVLSSQDARAEEARWREAGLTTYEPVYFERDAQLPDGSNARVAFTLAFAVDERMPDAVFFCCQQHAREAFWQSDYQRHPNGARDISSVILAADDPRHAAGFVQSLTGVERARPVAGGFEVQTALGSIEVIAGDAAAERLAGHYAPLEDASAHFAAAAVRVRDLGLARACLEGGSIPHVPVNGRIIVPPTSCFGLTLEFVER